MSSKTVSAKGKRQYLRAKFMCEKYLDLEIKKNNIDFNDKTAISNVNYLIKTYYTAILHMYKNHDAIQIVLNQVKAERELHRMYFAQIMLELRNVV